MAVLETKALKVQHLIPLFIQGLKITNLLFMYLLHFQIFHSLR